MFPNLTDFRDDNVPDEKVDLESLLLDESFFPEVSLCPSLKYLVDFLDSSPVWGMTLDLHESMFELLTDVSETALWISPMKHESILLSVYF